MCSKQTGRFSGDASLEVGSVESKSEEGSSESITEEERLSVVVREIDNTASIVPKGAYIAEATHDIIKNRYFDGLSTSQASGLSNYFHFRPPTGPAKNILKQNGLVSSVDFLDSIEGDLPTGGSWAITFNESKTAVSVRSLVYPGYHFWHILNTNKFGAAYFGSGVKENDIVFMF